MPEVAAVKAIQKITWAASSGSLHLVHATNEDIHRAHEKVTAQGRQIEQEDNNVCREALEVLTICLALCPQALEMLDKEKHWQNFIIDLLLLARSR